MNNRQKLILQTELSKEDKTISELRQIYEQALIDSNTKIMELSMRTDMQNLQAIVYQKQYQEAIKGQIEGILDQLNANQYATVSDYLKDCYIDGFVGNMYDLAGQGIPMIVPINQNQVVKAIQTDSKLSKSLYTSLGENVQYLKTAVRVQVSRGIANGSTWNEIAQHLAGNFKNTPFEKAINNTIRIARTEGHRVQNAAKMDAMNAAKEKGADIVKQWDSTMDNRTRESHRKLNGQIRELDEPFEVWGKKADAPSMFGDPSEDINCRCAVLQRAKWALDKDELETLQQRAESFELDKADDFDDFKEKYLDATSDKEPEETSLSDDIDSLKDEMKNLEEQMDNATTLEEMAAIQEKQDEVQAKIDEINKEKIKAEEIEKINIANNAINETELFEKEINLENCDAKCAEAIASVSAKMKDEFPDVQFNNVRISNDSMKGERFTDMDSLGKTTGNSIAFNGSYMNNSEKTEALLEKMYELGKGSTGTIEGNVAHEYGHALTNYYDVKSSDIQRAIMEDEGYDINKGMTKAEFDNIFHISSYGDTDADEWFSECFADYMANEEPREISIKAVEKFKELAGLK